MSPRPPSFLDFWHLKTAFQLLLGKEFFGHSMVIIWTDHQKLTDFKKNENFGFFEIRSEVSGTVLVDRKVVCIGPD